MGQNINKQSRYSVIFLQAQITKFGCFSYLGRETQLLEFTEDITRNMENGKQTDVLIMEFSKAFDKVCHSLLVH